jgi:hypothetical protein
LAEGKRVLKEYLRGRVRMLQEAGLSGSLANKAASAEVKALDAAYALFDVLDEVREAGRLEVAVQLWVEFYATLLTDLPKEVRRQFMEAVLDVAEEIDEKIEGLNK